jgi:hypothetical protein
MYLVGIVIAAHQSPWNKSIGISARRGPQPPAGVRSSSVRGMFYGTGWPASTKLLILQEHGRTLPPAFALIPRDRKIGDGDRIRSAPYRNDSDFICEICGGARPVGRHL